MADNFGCGIKLWDYENTYKSFPIRMPPDSVLEQINRRYPSSGNPDISSVPSGWPGEFRCGLMPPPPPPNIEFGDFFMPTGARRWGVFRCLMSGGDVRSMLTEGASTLGVFMVDGSGGKIGVSDNPGDGAAKDNPKMHRLPPRPIYGLDGTVDLYEVVLVDERYMWWRTAYGGSGYGFGTWADVLNPLIGTPPSSFSADYLTPAADSPLWLEDCPDPLRIDMGCASVGHVLVWDSGDKSSNGEFRPIPYATANSNAEAASLAAQRSVGGPLWLQSGSGEERRGLVPNSVNVMFPRWRRSRYSDAFGTNVKSWSTIYSRPGTENRHDQSNAGWPVVWDTVNITKASLGSPYSSWVSAASPGNEVWIWTRAKAIYGWPGSAYEDSGSPVNQTEMDDLAAALAKDYMDGLNCNVDEEYDGIVDFDRMSACDILWSWRRGGVSTRARRQPFNFRNIYLHNGNDGDGTPQAVGNCLGYEPTFSGSNPGTGDDAEDGYVTGSLWINDTTDDAYMCCDNTVGAAVWKKITP